MATKKQKHEAAIAKHDAEMAEIRRTGLAAQEHDRVQREKRKALAKADAERLDNSAHTKIINHVFEGLKPDATIDEARAKLDSMTVEDFHNLQGYPGQQFR